MPGGDLMTGRNRYYCKVFQLSAAQWLSDAADALFSSGGSPGETDDSSAVGWRAAMLRYRRHRRKWPERN